MVRFKSKQLVRQVALFYIFANLFNVCLNIRQLECPVWCCCQSVAMSFENQALPKYRAGKGGAGIFITFSETCGFSSFILYPILDKW